MGSPGQTFALVLDTGSADLWVAGTDCTGSLCPSSLFDANQSSSWQPINRDVQFSYAEGHVSGQAGKETVTLGGITIEDQDIAVVDEISAAAVGDPESGIMGMALPSLASLGTPWWLKVYQSGQVSQQLFAFWLKRDADEGGQLDGNGGEYSIGETDSSKYTGEINYVPLVGQDYWSIPLDYFSVSGNAIEGSGGRAAIDTGTSLIGASPDLAAKFYASVPGAHPHSDVSLRRQGYWEYNCSTQVNASITFGNVAYDIKNSDFGITHMTPDPTSCTGSIFEAGLGGDAPVDYIVGATFLKNVYSVYNYGSLSVGFADLVHSS